MLKKIKDTENYTIKTERGSVPNKQGQKELKVNFEISIY